MEETGEKREFYRVDRYRSIVFAQRSALPASRGRRAIRSTILVLDSVGGFLSSLLGITIMFGGLFAVLIGAFYGPIAFLLSTGGALGLMALYMNKKAGKSLQFADAPLTMKIIGQIVGSALVLGFMLFLLEGLPRLLG